MNKTKIEWCDYTWNPITGCTTGCSFCYARKIAMRFDGHFKPTFHPDRIVKAQKMFDRWNKDGESHRIFVGSMGDLFDPHVKWTWLEELYKIFWKNPRQKFIVLTKQPENYIAKFEKPMPSNVWVGVSAGEKEGTQKRISYLKALPIFHRFISFEPLLFDVASEGLNLCDIDWLIIGAQTNPHVLPQKKWVERIIFEARKRQIPIFLKNNLEWPNKIQEYPYGN